MIRDYPQLYRNIFLALSVVLAVYIVYRYFG